ncbi:hypothetical protein COLO4_32234 [Corchorus olitorius]|uniref:Uncharacterized protein n=1 Tax=Corchorus olitorius TaxID=93759 RepID=A0A1R3H060_9ROSI|nr:hypothetical protein COLO4_32234 [Corchorus olitorius]
MSGNHRRRIARGKGEAKTVKAKQSKQSPDG